MLKCIIFTTFDYHNRSSTGTNYELPKPSSSTFYVFMGCIITLCNDMYACSSDYSIFHSIATPLLVYGTIMDKWIWKTRKENATMDRKDSIILLCTLWSCWYCFICCILTTSIMVYSIYIIKNSLYII